MASVKCSILPKKSFECELCNYKCSKQSIFNKHLSTRKHAMLVDASNSVFPDAKWFCGCGKIFKHDSSLYRHKKKCNFVHFKEYL